MCRPNLVYRFCSCTNLYEVQSLEQIQVRNALDKQKTRRRLELKPEPAGLPPPRAQLALNIGPEKTGSAFSLRREAFAVLPTAGWCRRLARADLAAAMRLVALVVLGLVRHTATAQDVGQCEGSASPACTHTSAAVATAAAAAATAAAAHSCNSCPMLPLFHMLPWQSTRPAPPVPHGGGGRRERADGKASPAPRRAAALSHPRQTLHPPP